LFAFCSGPPAPLLSPFIFSFFEGAEVFGFLDLFFGQTSWLLAVAQNPLPDLPPVFIAF